MLNLTSFMIGTSDLEKLASFYEKVFDRKPDMSDADYKGWQAGSCFLTIGKHSDVNGESKEPARIIFNFETKEVKEEFERLKSFGAKVIKEPYEVAPRYWIATLADPDGNYFQLTTPWEEGS